MSKICTAIANESASRFSPPAETPAFALELLFTETYQRHQHEPAALREAACLRVMWPRMMQPPQEGDLLVGRIRFPLVGVSPQPGGFGYFCKEEAILKKLETESVPPAIARRVREMIEFWRTENTAFKTRAAFPPSVRRALPSDDFEGGTCAAYPLYRIGGVVLDFGKLLKLGIPGLAREARRLTQHADDAEARHFGEGSLAALEILADCCRAYARQLRGLHGEGQPDWTPLTAALEALPERAPETFLEAIQLVWLYALHAGTWNYGRMDDYLGGFLQDDLDAGRITEARALALLQSLWRLFLTMENKWDHRVFIGGKGRENESAADRFALLAIEATRTVFSNHPQLSLRFYAGQNPLLMEKAIDCLGDGRTFPILYNDDVNIPAYARALGVSEAVAVHYLPYGCGEYTLNHASVASPNGVINLLKCLELALHNGTDAPGRRRDGLATGALDQFRTFEDLWAAYDRQVTHLVEALAIQEKIEYDVTGGECAFLFASQLFDDCVQRGKPLLRGGARHLGGTLESYGNINTADSLTAIRKLVFEERVCTLAELVAACDANFAGHEALQRKLLAAPKFGNDDSEADAMAARVHNHICDLTTAQAKVAGLDSYLVVVINNSANVILGHQTAASPDGRTSGDAMANAINPTSGRDVSGVTAFLNSLVKMDTSRHAGAVQNMKFSRQLFRRDRRKLEALLDGYFQQGGAQAMITVVDRRDLEAAMREPEKWGHLMVRVGGFSARFVDLTLDVQLEILRRTLHE